MTQLQRVQNWLARVVCKTSKFCHITPVLHSIHWLKIKYRIVFKINTLVYKTLHTNQPVYLRELLSLSEKQRTRASGTRQLIRPRSPKTEAGSYAFLCCCCSLPLEFPSCRSTNSWDVFHLPQKIKDTLLCILLSILIVWPDVDLTLMTLTDHGHDSWICFGLKRLWACHTGI